MFFLGKSRTAFFPFKHSYLRRQHCRLTICIELVEQTNSVSDDKIQITILILRRGALSNIFICKYRVLTDKVYIACGIHVLQ